MHSSRIILLSKYSNLIGIAKERNQREKHNKTSLEKTLKINQYQMNSQYNKINMPKIL